MSAVEIANSVRAFSELKTSEQVSHPPQPPKETNTFNFG